MTIGEMVSRGLECMGIGVGTVFLALAFFFVVIKVLVKIWPSKDV